MDGVTTEYDPCGECPKGACDECDGCIFARQFAPDDDWIEDEEGFVTAPLSYENREGQPEFNGAFNAW